MAEPSADAILSATERLLATLLQRNGIASEDVVSAFFTATDDLVAAFPAEAAWRIGLGAVPLMCARADPRCRGDATGRPHLVHFHTGRSQAEVVPAYLDGAESLRDDLG